MSRLSQIKDLLGWGKNFVSQAIDYNSISKGASHTAKGIGEGVFTEYKDYAIPFATSAMGGAKGLYSYDEEKDNSNLGDFYGLGRINKGIIGAMEGFSLGLAGTMGIKASQGLGAHILNNNRTASFYRSMSERESRSNSFLKSKSRSDSFIKPFLGPSQPPGILNSMQTGYDAKFSYDAKDFLTSARRELTPFSFHREQQSKAHKKWTERKIDRTPGYFTKTDQSLFSLGVALTEGPAFLGGAIGYGARGAKQVVKDIGGFYKNHVLDTKSLHGTSDVASPAPPGKSAGKPLISNPYNKLLGATTIGVAGVATMGAAFIGSASGAPDGHPVNALYKPDQTTRSRAQLEADMANKVKMQNPMAIGLNDVAENYYTNPSLKPMRGRHIAGKYNDDGSLVFALSTLRRG